MLSLTQELSSSHQLILGCRHIYLVLPNQVDVRARLNALFATNDNSNSRRLSTVTHLAAPSLGQSIRDWSNSHFAN